MAEAAETKAQGLVVDFDPMSQEQTPKPAALSYELQPVVRPLTLKDYSNALAEAIGVCLLGLFGTGIIGHVFGEDLTGFEEIILVACLYIVPLLLGCWQFQRALKRFRSRRSLNAR